MVTEQGYVDGIVHNGTLRIATRDYGGSGRPALLIHGACRNLEDWAAIAPYLVRHCRLVAMDLRSHGKSDEAPWEWASVMRDVDAVVAAYRLSRPVIIGHSLGGMIAAMYAGVRDECSAAVNIDGHAAGPNPRILGLEPAAVRERWDTISELNVRILPGRGLPVSDSEFPSIRQEMIEFWVGLGVPAEIEAASLERSKHSLSNGRIYFRPSAGSAQPMLSSAFALDLYALYRRLKRPLLIFNGIGADADDMPGVPWWREFVSAYHETVRAGLADLARDEQHIAVETVDDTHYLFVKQPRATAERIIAFLASAVGLS